MQQLNEMAQRLSNQLEQTPCRHWQNQISHWYQQISHHGHTTHWLQVLSQLPTIPLTICKLNQSVVEVVAQQALDTTTMKQLEFQLKQMKPWRKGPFQIFNLYIDSEWRSDLKWQRLCKALDLNQKDILDVGCGNGYYAYRMLGAGANRIIGVEPHCLYHMQFQAINYYARQSQIIMIPSRLEDLAPTDCFDMVFSMGVIYHRKSPLEHLQLLKQFLKPGGTLILESIVVNGDQNFVLTPEDRYARMKNVWMIPSPDSLTCWLRKTGWRNVQTLDVSTTTIDEQRSTEWMTSESLAQSLDPLDPNKTVEGYPAPQRVIISATKEP